MRFAELIGLEESGSHEKVVRVALEKANTVLGPEVPFRFRFAADLSPPAPPDVVPVLLVNAIAPSQGICHVPLGTRYVVVDASEVLELADTLSGNFSGRGDLNTERLLTICLLHEAGHIYYGDSGVGAIATTADHFNDLATRAKELELRADRFAAGQIRSAMNERFPSGRFVAAGMLPVELLDVSFNLTGKRVIDNFGKSSLRPREVFLDDNFTHPNLELRMLLITYFIYPSEEGATLIEEFQRSRRRASETFYLDYDR